MSSYQRVTGAEGGSVEDGVGSAAPSHMLPLEVDSHEPRKAQPDSKASGCKKEEDTEALLSEESQSHAWTERLYLAGLIITAALFVCTLLGGGVVQYLAITSNQQFRNSIQGHLRSSNLNLSASLPASLFQNVPRNARYTVEEREVTLTDAVFSYNNFYEFSTDKRVSNFIGPHAAAIGMTPNPAWTVRFDGLTKDGGAVDINLATILANTGPLEERLYRHRCVEAWSMVVPWIGFPLSKLLEMVPPASDAAYVRFESFYDVREAVNQRHHDYNPYTWPYVEGLTIQEARNELAFVAVGIFQQPLPPQNGAPLRLVIPWKYGFKSIKTITRISYTIERPETFWSKADGLEYGFWANVNPSVPHPRWSQASEWSIPDGPSVPTKMFNGYASFVEHLYTDLQNETLFT